MYHKIHLFLWEKKNSDTDSHAENKLTLSLFFMGGGGVHGKAYWLKVYTFET